MPALMAVSSLARTRAGMSPGCGVRLEPLPDGISEHDDHLTSARCRMEGGPSRIPQTVWCSDFRLLTRVAVAGAGCAPMPVRRPEGNPVVKQTAQPRGRRDFAISEARRGPRLRCRRRRLRQARRGETGWPSRSMWLWLGVGRRELDKGVIVVIAFSTRAGLRLG